MEIDSKQWLSEGSLSKRGTKWRRIVCGVAGVVALCSNTPLFAGAAPGVFDTSWLGFDTGVYAADASAWYPVAMAAADFDGDGNIDIATGNKGNFLPVAPRVSVIFNQGDGTYGPPTAYTTAKPTDDLIAADFDGDGAVDIAVSNTGNHGDGTTVSILWNLGDGTFAPEDSYATGAAGPIGLASADFDDDGHLDIAVANWGRIGQGNTVSLLRNQGDATFAAPQVFAVNARPYKLETGDFNGDARPDLVVVHGGTGLQQFTEISVLINNGAGFDVPAMLPTMYSGGSFSPCVEVADMNRDGHDDIIYSDLKFHQGDNWNTFYAVAVISGRGNGTFDAAQKLAFGSSTGALSELACGDLNGDGWPDVAGVHDSNEGWSVILSDGQGGYLPYTELVSGEYPTDLTIDDVDGDGDLDIQAVARFSMEVTVHFNPGDGDFSLPPNYTVTGGSYHMDAADIDGDGDLDFAASRGYASNGSIDVLFNLGDGSLSAPTVYEAPVYATAVKLRDLNGDELPDLLWADKYPPYSFRSKLNLGDGVFGATQSWLSTFTCGIAQTFDAMQAFDLDGDGDLDPILGEDLGCGGGAGPKRIFVHENDGAGNFTLVGIYDMPWPPQEIMSADLNHDGHADIVTAGRTISVLLGNGDMTLQQPYTAGSFDVAANNAALADLNGDGHIDVAMTVPNDAETYSSLGVMLGHGDGTFQSPVLYRGTYSPNLLQMTSIATGDADMDGDVDVMIGNYAANDVSFFENNGDGTFQRQYHFGAANSTRDLFVGDITGDGMADLAAMVTRPDAGIGTSVIAIVAGRQPFVFGDGDGDGDVDLADVAVFTGCLGGPFDFEIDPSCNVFDFNLDGDVDLQDFSAMQTILKP